jgi:PAS domain S-box-containing protein
LSERSAVHIGRSADQLNSPEARSQLNPHLSSPFLHVPQKGELCLWFRHSSGNSEAIVGKSLDGIVLSWNSAAERLFGYAAEEMIGQSLERLVPANRRDERGEILSHVREGQRVEEIETERINRDGHVFNVSLTISPVRDEDNHIIGAAMICRDISARKEADRRLAEHVSHITALRQIDESIAGTFNLPLTLSTVIAQNLLTFDVEAAYIYLVDRTTSELVLECCEQRSRVPIDQDRQGSADAIARRAVQTISTVSTGKIPDTFLGCSAEVDASNQMDARLLINQRLSMGVMVIEYEPRHRSIEQFHLWMPWPDKPPSRLSRTTYIAIFKSLGMT